jgi:hypothetical protein
MSAAQAICGRGGRSVVASPLVAGRNSWSPVLLSSPLAWVRCGSDRRLPCTGCAGRRHRFLLGSVGLGHSRRRDRSRGVCDAPKVSTVLCSRVAQRRGDAAKQTRARHRDHLRDQRRIRSRPLDRVAVGCSLIGVTREPAAISPREAHTMCVRSNRPHIHRRTVHFCGDPLDQSRCRQRPTAACRRAGSDRICRESDALLLPRSGCLGSSCQHTGLGEPMQFSPRDQ